MPSISKYFKLKAFSENRVGKYLLYALGEVILVVLGILIALTINNKNEASKEDKKMKAILQSVAEDLKQDTLLIGTATRYYKARDSVAQMIIKGDYELNSIMDCPSCANLLTFYYPINLNDKGYLQLKNFSPNNKETDTLGVQIVQFYNAITPLFKHINGKIEAATFDTVEEWRDTKPWFADLIAGKIDDEFISYLNSSEFRNKTAFQHAIIQSNFRRITERYLVNATQILTAIDERYGDVNQAEIEEQSVPTDQELIEDSNE